MSAHLRRGSSRFILGRRIQGNRDQNLIDYSLNHAQPLQRMLSKSVHNIFYTFLMQTHRQSRRSQIGGGRRQRYPGRYSVVVEGVVVSTVSYRKFHSRNHFSARKPEMRTAVEGRILFQRWPRWTACCYYLQRKARLFSAWSWLSCTMQCQRRNYVYTTTYIGNSE